MLLWTYRAQRGHECRGPGFVETSPATSSSQTTWGRAGGSGPLGLVAAEAELTTIRAEVKLRSPYPGIHGCPAHSWAETLAWSSERRRRKSRSPRKSRSHVKSVRGAIVVARQMSQIFSSLFLPAFTHHVRNKLNCCYPQKIHSFRGVKRSTLHFPHEENSPKA